MRPFALLLLFVFGSLAQTDEITSLPGLPAINFKQYSGYINVDRAHGRNLFYWFVQSQTNPSTDPLVLWLNGGPGCSSIGGGLLEELGPFRPNKQGTLDLNPQSWNKIANIIFLESPAGVGFSYSDTTSDYVVGDVRTANDSYTFLQGFFDRYPNFINRDFWITGESYGGHYVPELAKRVLVGNQKKEGHNINLKGFMAGNAWTDPPVDNAGALFDWWSHALISDSTFKMVMENCNFSTVGPLSTFNLKKNEISAPNPALCTTYTQQAMTEMGNINIYDIYADVCTGSEDKILEQLSKFSELHKNMLNFKLKNRQINPPYVPCEDNYIQTYLNRADVKSAIHAKKDIVWGDCSSVVQYNYEDVLSSVSHLYDEFKVEAPQMRILVYSGDVDAIVPYPGTRQWVANLKRRVLKPWRPWIVNQQVGGYVTVFDGLTFATVRNAGHLVPFTQPERAYVMFSSFLKDEPFPAK